MELSNQRSEEINVAEKIVKLFFSFKIFARVLTLLWSSDEKRPTYHQRMVCRTF